MSRIGKRPIAIPSGVDVHYTDRVARFKGPKGENEFHVPAPVDLEVDGGEIRILADFEGDPKARALSGTVQACVSNMVTGVSTGFTRRLQLVGVGYRAQVQGRNLEMSLGYSHPVRLELPEGVNADMEGNTLIVLSSHDNVLLGRTAAAIRAKRPPEPYQGKGVLYEGERLRRKAGKTGKK